MNNKEYIISEISILKLHGEYDYKLELKDNKLVIVSENGMGKTTVVNIIFYALSRQWEKLKEYDFESVNIKINDIPVNIVRKDLVGYTRLKRNRTTRNIRRYPPKYRRILEDIIETNSLEDISRINLNTIKNLAIDKGLEPEMLIDFLSDHVQHGAQKTLFEEFETELDILKKFNENTQMLYLPTYRRIEQDLTEIFPDLETNLDTFRRNKIRQENDNRPYLELVDFGMDDVETKIKNRLYELNQNLNNSLKNSITGTYLQDIINKKYKSYNLSNFKKIDTTDLNVILGRIDDSILSKTEKDRLREFVDSRKDSGSVNQDDKIVGHFISSLMNIYDLQQEEEKDVDEFVNICKEYMIHKDFIYDRDELEIKISLKRNQRHIKFKNLSSGEKQVVSLFSHLHLSKEKKYFVIIDEPELSLSVLWQKRLLPDIINSNLCTGMIAVTHSPYIFRNELKPYTHSLEEFKSISI